MSLETYDSRDAASIAPRRNRYFYGKLLDEFHLLMEQQYHNNKRWLLNRLSLGSGVLCGLELTSKGGRVLVSPGVAVDAWGREIIVPCEASLDPWSLTVESPEKADRLNPEEDHTVYLCIAYRECLTDFSPVLVTECDAQDHGAAGTIMEGYVFMLSQTAPPKWPNKPSEDLCKAVSVESVEGRLQELCSLMAKGTCQTAEGHPCVVLGELELNRKPADAEQSIGKVDNCTFRKRAYSNETLFEMLMCKTSGGSTGPQGPPGPGITGVTAVSGPQVSATLHDGIIDFVIPAGEKGDPGPGLETGLTRIVALSWEHGAAYGGSQPFLVNVDISSADTSLPPDTAVGLVIGFDKKVKPPFPKIARPQLLGFFDRLLAMEVLVLTPIAGTFTLSWNLILGMPLVVSDYTTNGSLITTAKITMEPDGSVPTEGKGIAFITSKPRLTGPMPVLVRLRGDFFVDRDLVDPERPGRAIDAEFVRGELPTGDRPKNSEYGIQGGTFESWFYPQPQDLQIDPRAERVSLNRGSMVDLAFVPGIGLENAMAIAAARLHAPDRFTSLDKLVGIGTIDKETLKQIRKRVEL